MGNDLSLMGVRRQYADLISELQANQDRYAKRKAEIIRQYGDAAHFRGDVILDDLSSGAKTLSAMIAAYAGVMQAEWAWVQINRTYENRNR